MSHRAAESGAKAREGGGVAGKITIEDSFPRSLGQCIWFFLDPG